MSKGEFSVIIDKGPMVIMMFGSHLESFKSLLKEEKYNIGICLYKIYIYLARGKNIHIVNGSHIRRRNTLVSIILKANPASKL